MAGAKWGNKAPGLWGGRTVGAIRVWLRPLWRSGVGAGDAERNGIDAHLRFGLDVEVQTALGDRGVFVPIDGAGL